MICGDNRFEIIEAAKKDIIESTNINTDPEEMAVLSRFLFRCWQMGWLSRYEPREDGVYYELFAVKNNKKYTMKTISGQEMAKILTNNLMNGVEELWKIK